MNRSGLYKVSCDTSRFDQLKYNIKNEIFDQKLLKHSKKIYYDILFNSYLCL